MNVQGGVSGNIIASFISTYTGGRLVGNLWGGKGIASAAIAGGILAGGSVNSALGSITKLVVTGGNIDGSITAPSGALTALTFSGSVGATGNISAATMGAVTVPGAVSGTISATTSFTSLKVGSVNAGAFISSPNLGSVTTTGNLNGVLRIGKTATSVKIAVGGSFGGDAAVNSPWR